MAELPPGTRLTGFFAWLPGSAMPVDLDPPTKAVLAMMADAGYVVAIGSDPDGGVVASAQDSAGETWQVRAADAYAAVVELAAQVGFDLADG